MRTFKIRLFLKLFIPFIKLRLISKYLHYADHSLLLPTALQHSQVKTTIQYLHKINTQFIHSLLNIHCFRKSINLWHQPLYSNARSQQNSTHTTTQIPNHLKFYIFDKTCTPTSIHLNMNKFTLLNCTLLLCFSMCTNTFGQTTNPDTTKAFVYFNMKRSTLPDKNQSSTLIGCNTVVAVDSANPKGFNGLEWDKSYQVYPGNIPYGAQYDSTTQKPYFVSKYYVASPPVFENKIEKNTLYDIGIVTPDEFSLVGDKPVQAVNMDYTVLRLMYIAYLPVQFDATFADRKDTMVPFRVECTNFPWLGAKKLPNAKGASGIGLLNYNPLKKEKLFLPYYYQKQPQSADSVKTYLECQVTILNDVLLNYEVFFKIDGKLYTSINLKDYKDGSKTIYITRKKRKRSDVPCGCKEPKSAK